MTNIISQTRNFSLNRMPKKGSIFRGEINDLSREEPDSTGWWPREIIFHKTELRSQLLNLYPNAGDKIILDDQMGGLYECNFTKPESKKRVCLGKPQQLKPWYRKKGFSDELIKQVVRDGSRDIVYFEYTGDHLRFFFFTETEFTTKYS